MTEADALNLATARRLYAAAGAGDWEAAETDLHADLVIHEAGSLPYAGTYRGRDALRRLTATVSSFWPGARIERQGMAAGDGRVVVFFRLHVTTPTGPITQEIVEVNEFQDGKVAVIKPFYWDAGCMGKLARELGRAA
jgi:ketosteroid isomerase-like protein